MKRVLTILGALAVATGTIGLSSSASAGDPSMVDVTVNVAATGSQAANVATYVPTFIVDGGPGTITPTCTAEPVPGSALGSGITYTCPLPPGSTYEVTIPEPPSPHERVRFCAGDGTPVIDLGGEPLPESVQCFAFAIAPMIVLEKDLPQPESESGPLEVPDFTLEVFPAGGGAAVGTTNDPSVDPCAADVDLGTLCGFVEVERGDYVVGEASEYGYVPLDVECRAEWFADGPTPLEPIDNPDAAVSIDPEANQLTQYFSGCTISNYYVESRVDVFKTVTNDDGGTATPDDWTIELFDDEGTAVTSVACATDGTCISDTFPIGQYTVGEVGPDGYESSVSRTIITIATEALPDPEATFDLEFLTAVDITVASDDQPTTTTTTAEPTTTVELTTTTDFGAGAGTLPATGSTQRNANIALVAVGLVLFGAAALVATRRR